LRVRFGLLVFWGVIFFLLGLLMPHLYHELFG
jgi:hypothetical protein